MLSDVLRQLGSQRNDRRVGTALVNWLNHPPRHPILKGPAPGHRFLEELVADALVVFGGLARYSKLHQLTAANKAKKVSSDLWQSFKRLNATLATFSHAPFVHPQEFYDGNFLSWRVVTEESPIALVADQARWVLQLFDSGAIAKVHKCQQCAKWYFA